MEPPMSNGSMQHHDPDLDFDDTRVILQGASCTITVGIFIVETRFEMDDISAPSNMVGTSSSRTKSMVGLEPGVPTMDFVIGKAHSTMHSTVHNCTQQYDPD